MLNGIIKLHEECNAMKDTIPHNKSQFEMLRNAKKIRGKKAPIIIKQKIYQINKISQYNLSKELCGVGFEYLVLKCSYKREGTLLLFGKIIARSSSDFLSLLANKLIAKSESERSSSERSGANLDLIQYPLSKKDPTRRLIIIMNCIDLIDAADITSMEDILLQFHKRFRKAMNDIINNSIDIEK
jgi:hypothetical protein